MSVVILNRIKTVSLKSNNLKIYYQIPYYLSFLLYKIDIKYKHTYFKFKHNIFTIFLFLGLNIFL